MDRNVPRTRSEGAIEAPESGSLRSAAEQGELLSERQVLEREVGAGPERRAQGAQERREALERDRAAGAVGEEVFRALALLDGRICYRLKRPLPDGRCELFFTPTEFLRVRRRDSAMANVPGAAAGAG